MILEVRCDDLDSLTSKILPHLISSAKKETEKSRDFKKALRMQLIVISGLLKYLLVVESKTIAKMRKEYSLPDIALAGRKYGRLLATRARVGYSSASRG